VEVQNNQERDRKSKIPWISYHHETYKNNAPTPTFEVKFVLLQQNSGKFVARLKQPVAFENKPQHVVVFQSPGS